MITDYIHILMSNCDQERLRISESIGFLTLGDAGSRGAPIPEPGLEVVEPPRSIVCWDQFCMIKTEWVFTPGWEMLTVVHSGIWKAIQSKLHRRWFKLTPQWIILKLCDLWPNPLLTKLKSKLHIQNSFAWPVLLHYLELQTAFNHKKSPQSWAATHGHCR